ncbi:MAG: SidA/IucD/PvdA family monooxygenase [bacterium]|nr:SidA/IucD/PvdA family monooxygenase [bacterium]
MTNTTSSNGAPPLDLIGIGTGPSNLSVASLAEPVPELRTRFLDRRRDLSWHSGLMFRDSALTNHGVSCLKDLVTLVDPTSRYSFLAFLAAKNRLYRFIAADMVPVPRIEFEQYFKWVAATLPSVELGCNVERVEFDGRHFLVHGEGRAPLQARNIALGSGLSASVPDCAQSHLGDRVFHAAEFLHRLPDAAGKRLAIIGGGQTGAEIVRHVMGDAKHLPADVLWVSQRDNFGTLDGSPFAGELFFPNHSEYFHGLPEAARSELLAAHSPYGDGVRPEVLSSLYRRLYELEFYEGTRPSYEFLPDYELREIMAADGDYTLTLRENRTGQLVSRGAVDYVVLATGFKHTVPAYMDPLLDRIAMSDSEFVMKPNFSVTWDGPDDRRIYAHSPARGSHGIAETYLSLVAWRSAVMINSLVGKPVYNTGPTSSVLQWTGPSRTVADVEQRTDAWDQIYLRGAHESLGAEAPPSSDRQ